MRGWCVAAVGAAFLLVSCGDGSDEDGRRDPVASRAPAVSHEESGALSTGGFNDGRALASLDALADDSVIVARVSLVRRLEDYWPSLDRRLTVFSRYELRVEETLLGDVQAGTTVEVFLQGGVKAEWGDPRPGGAGFEPRAGEPTVDHELAWWPRFKEGREELVFLAERPIRGSGEIVLFAPGDGRYRVIDGKVVSLYVDVSKDPAELDVGDYRREIIGLTVPELAEKLRQLRAN